MSVGPLFLALPRLFLLLGLGAAMLAAYVVERRSGSVVERPLWLSLIAGLVVARLAYVLTHLADFAATPWQALYLWQDGYSPLVGVIAASLTALWIVRRRQWPPMRLFGPLLAGVLVWGGMNWLTYALQQGVNRPLPELALQDLAGKSIALASYQGKPVVMNLWASWCPPCRREMPVLAASQTATPEVHFLFVNQGEGPQQIRKYLEAEQLQLDNVLLDLGGRVAQHFGAAGLPTTLFFDADGQLVDTHMGELSRARLGDYLNQLRTQD